MTQFHFITYCTHDMGTFQELKNNSLGYDIKVLGWGKPWKGFLDRCEKIVDHLSDYKDEDVICLVDGFDVIPKKHVDIFKERFFEMDAPIIISLHSKTLFSKKVFGTCQNGKIANAGMYCGYVKAMRNILQDMVKDGMSTDDQRNLNAVCKDHDVRVDVDQRLFYNIPHLERFYKNNTSDACFLGSPGQLNMERIKRAPKEYGPFIWKELIAIFIITFIVIKIFQKIKNKFMRIILILCYLAMLYYLTR